jgi:hypothetical protein
MMAHPLTSACQWSTRSSCPSDDNSTGDLLALHAHLAQCQRSSHSAFFLRGAASEFGAFLLARVISTLFLTILLLAGLAQVL